MTIKIYEALDIINIHVSEGVEIAPNELYRIDEKYIKLDDMRETEKLSVEKLQEYLLPYKKEMVQKIIDEKMQLVTADEFLKLEKEYLTAIKENDKLKEQLNTVEKVLTEIPKSLSTEDTQTGLIHYQPLDGIVSKVECQTCGEEFEDNNEFFSIAYPFCSLECWDNYTKYEGETDEIN